MLSEWSVECSADDPVLVVPWSDPSDSTGNRRFIDLRENPYDLDHLPEAEHYRERSIFASFHLQEQMLHRLTRHAAPLEHPYALLDCIIRPAMVDLTGPQEGFAVSLYVKAAGHDVPSAEANWASALDAVVAVLRSKEFVLT
jgi:hypothetical protein